MQCHGCGNAVEIVEKVGRGDTCPSCERPLRCCRNCSFYDPSASNKCREPQAEWVSDREAANFCEYFAPSAASSSEVAGSRSDETRRKLDDLFS
ncbi:MAG: hypothetical protein FVQ81_00185 [Candidatus Glassbacteria bacterium]|nr:hypothetical protein [Candidatus Glassbacteria bacterium]